MGLDGFVEHRERLVGVAYVVRAESVTIAMLIVLESLSPLERAVFVLREVFDQPYASIAGTLGKEEPNPEKVAGSVSQGPCRCVLDGMQTITIVGGGRAGLTAAISGAEQGASVVLHEAPTCADAPARRTRRT
ncbi:sigma factor-like helix-turn-helix DNA-binding protein [Actinomadura sp. 7K507]|uniref:sigma factor-like helix-turn-helix DNA-binding protein n=1 Tax=Actinomadura sp. 7K507 TaxID=2530365 RepID=UPI0026990DFC